MILRVFERSCRCPAWYHEQMIDIDTLSPDDATVLPVKMQWQLVTYWRETDQLDRAEALIDANLRRTGPSLTDLSERHKLALARGETAAAVDFAQKRVDISATASSVSDLIR